MFILSSYSTTVSDPLRIGTRCRTSGKSSSQCPRNLGTLGLGIASIFDSQCEALPSALKCTEMAGATSSAIGTAPLTAGDDPPLPNRDLVNCSLGGSGRYDGGDV